MRIKAEFLVCKEAKAAAAQAGRFTRQYVQSAFKQAGALARRHNVDVEFDLNGIKCLATPVGNPQTGVENYDIAIERHLSECDDLFDYPYEDSFGVVADLKVPEIQFRQETFVKGTKLSVDLLATFRSQKD